MIGPPEMVRFDATQTPLAKTLADTRILFNGVSAPLLYVSATRSSAIVRYSMRDQSTVDVQVEYQGLPRPGPTPTTMYTVALWEGPRGRKARCNTVNAGLPGAARLFECSDIIELC
jgi:uncharacterized protein (TIGR03437 family)